MVERNKAMATKVDHTPSSPPPMQPRISHFSSRSRYKRGQRRRSMSPRNTTYPRYEKSTMLLLFVIAWGWILVTVGMLARYHQGIPVILPPMIRSRLPVSPESVVKMDPAVVAAAAAAAAAATSDKVVKVSPFHRKSDLETHLEPFSSPLIVFTCQRPQYLRQTLDDIYKYRDTTCRMGCPLIISQDGRDQGILDVVQVYQQKFAAVGVPLIHLIHDNNTNKGGLRKQNAYKLLAQHYGWALEQIFGDKLQYTLPDDAMTHYTLQANRLVILEEDIHIAVDFFNYFTAMTPILDHDPDLLAVSAFNDNGLAGRVADPKRVVRSDFFPGLGWMMTRKLWKDELAAKWPDGYWDDWLREPAQRRGRHILRPEVSRTFHFGSKGGASNNQFGDKLSHIQLNDQEVDWSQYDVVSSLPADRFDRAYWALLHSAYKVDNVAQANQRISSGNVRVEYRNLKEFAKLAEQFQLMTDEKAGIPRTAYNGVVETRLDGKHFLFLTPPMEELQKAFVHAI